MKNILTKRRMKCIAVIIGVVILPLLYSYFYLGAFWDPYSRLETLPVAVVNNDKGATINDVKRNLGQEMCDKLKADGTLKFVFTDETDAREGTESDQYYAMIVIPSDFSTDVASASTTDKQTASVTFSPNEKRNYLASQILGKAVLQIEVATRESVNKEIVQQLADKLDSVPDQMTTLQDGMAQLSDGSTQVNNGAAKLADGTQEFSSKFKEYQKGVSDIKDGTSTLTNGLGTLDSGITQLLDGANTLTNSTANIGDLTTGAQGLAVGANTFNQKLIEYTAGVDSLISNVSDTSTFLTYYVTKVNPAIMKDAVFAGFISKLSNPENAQGIKTLQAANVQLKAASEQIAAGAQQLADGTTNLPQLKAALVQLSQGLESAKAGSTQLSAGSQALYTGVSQLSSATAQLSDAATTIASGADTLSNGTNTLNNGISTAKSGVDTSIAEANSDVKALDGIADFAATPVSIDQQNITSVPNYGTAFAPYFLSLSLWVGGLMIFVGIYYDPDNKFKLLSRETDNKVLRSFAYLLIGLTQAIVLGIVLKVGLGLEVDNLPLYFVSCCLVSVVFISIIQFLMVYLKDAGKFLCMLLLILQLTSCAGTFPLETIPKLFNVLYPFMPMTYSVGLFKQSISGVNAGDLMFNGGILFGILIVFMTLTIVFTGIKAIKGDKIQGVFVKEV